MVSRFLYGDVADKRHVRLDYKAGEKIPPYYVYCNSAIRVTPT